MVRVCYESWGELWRKPPGSARLDKARSAQRYRTAAVREQHQSCCSPLPHGRGSDHNAVRLGAVIRVSDASSQLRPFDPLYAPAVASWVRDELELLWLAPSTVWPLTAAKVAGWTGPTDRPVLLFEPGESLPCGYAELNPLRDAKRQLWIGHLIIAPARRGCGLGRRFTRVLVEKAFADSRVQQVIMVVFPDNGPAIRCYKANGFRVVRQERHRFPPSRRVRVMLRMEITRAQALRVLTEPEAQELPLR